MAGFQIGIKRKIDDFVIPLRLDNSEWNWTMGDLASIPFHVGWATGWRQLLKKLVQIDFPRSLPNGAALAHQSMDTENLVIQEPETLRLNVIGATINEQILRVFALPRLNENAKKELQRRWAFYNIGDKAIALTRPPKDIAKGIRLISDTHQWASGGAILGVSTASILPALVRMTMWSRLGKIGCVVHPNPRKRETFYLPENFNETGKIQFTDLEGKRRSQKIRRYNTVRRGMEKEKIFFHFAFRCDLAKGLCAGFYIQLVPTLMFFDATGHPIVDDRVNRLRKKVSRMWYNEDWRDRFLAAEQLLLGTQGNSHDGIALAEEGVTLRAPCRLNEVLFEKKSLSELNAEEAEDAGELLEDEFITEGGLDED